MASLSVALQTMVGYGDGGFAASLDVSSSLFCFLSMQIHNSFYIINVDGWLINLFC